MNLLQLIGVTNTFQRCTECSKLIKPAIRAHNQIEHSAGYHCFRCYHILAAVTIVSPGYNAPAAEKGVV